MQDLMKNAKRIIIKFGTNIFKAKAASYVLAASDVKKVMAKTLAATAKKAAEYSK